jgi:hypothetical protein
VKLALAVTVGLGVAVTDGVGLKEGVTEGLGDGLGLLLGVAVGVGVGGATTNWMLSKSSVPAETVLTIKFTSSKFVALAGK